MKSQRLLLDVQNFKMISWLFINDIPILYTVIPAKIALIAYYYSVFLMFKMFKNNFIDNIANLFSLANTE